MQRLFSLPLPSQSPLANSQSVEKLSASNLLKVMFLLLRLLRPMPLGKILDTATINLVIKLVMATFLPLIYSTIL